MWEKLKKVERHFEEIGRQLTDPKVIADRALFQKLSKEHKDLLEIISTFRAYRKAEEEHAANREIIENETDSELKSLALEEQALLEKELPLLQEQLKVLLLPKDPNDEKNVVLEIRAGTGGDEAALFAGELFRAYLKYCESKGWKVSLMSESHGPKGGYKEVIAEVNGEGAFSRLKFERGVHRVQRVPETEAMGRVHTSTVTVAVLPEAEDVEIAISEKDLRIDVYRSSGPGGQSVNTTDSAVRITHIPTGIVVAMQDEKSQHKNRERAMKVLRARLYEAKLKELESQRRDDRRSQVGSGERAEKIRTYNFPQSRVTDHRIGLSVHAIDQIMQGNLDQLIDPLITHYQTEALKTSSEQEN
ncbi:MAG TPA: peptide chain release factor 1 [Oligoflexia bacterium]|nr:peptide chain release factor 1 [Oligoflexia bacterium]HMP27603.1 peptide chain release factor 1 [Oligoflexia bacterium]